MVQNIEKSLDRAPSESCEMVGTCDTDIMSPFYFSRVLRPDCEVSCSKSAAFDS